MNKQRLEEKYEKEVVPALAKEFSIKNKLAIPRLIKVVVNVGIGEIAKNKESMELAKKDLAQITGQFPAVRNSKVSVASFNLRRGMPVGLTVTLRGVRMYAFVDRLFSIVLPRFRDFRGVSDKSFDKGGNYTLGIFEYTVFPEIDLAKSHALKGFEVTLVTSSQTKEKSKRLLELLGMPFTKADLSQGKLPKERSVSP
jgi:large subunit ribosomal protein L5